MLFTLSYLIAYMTLTSTLISCWPGLIGTGMAPASWAMLVAAESIMIGGTSRRHRR